MSCTFRKVPSDGEYENHSESDKLLRKGELRVGQFPFSPNHNFESLISHFPPGWFQVVWYPEGKDEIVLERNVSCSRVRLVLFLVI